MMHYGLLIRSNNLCNGKPYIHMDDACHERLESAISEAVSFKIHGGIDLIGIFSVDDVTGKVETVYDLTGVDQVAEENRRMRLSDAERKDEDNATEADRKRDA